MKIKTVVTICLILFIFLSAGVLAVQGGSMVISSFSVSREHEDEEFEDDYEEYTEETADNNTQSANTKDNSSNNSSSSQIQTTQCLITVDGSVYDVQQFKNQHSGGNIFTCGTDMSKVFHQQHNSGYLQMMEQYKVK